MQLKLANFFLQKKNDPSDKLNVVTEEYFKNMQRPKVEDIFNHKLATHMFESIVSQLNYVTI